MKKAVFLIRRDSVDTIQRYLLVSEKLCDFNITSVFLDLTNRLRPTIDCKFRELKLKHNPEYLKYGDCLKLRHKFKDMRRKVGYLISYKYDTIFKRKRGLLNRKGNDSNYPKSNRLGQLTNMINFNNGSVINKCLNRQLSLFESEIHRAERIVDEIKPDCVFYDIELIRSIQSFLYVARKRGIKIISMQHGEGNAWQYANLPLLADYYVAYSSFNSDVLKSMGVDDERIMLTGTPDTDLVHDYDRLRIKKEISHRYSIDPSRKSILVALKPESYKKQNIELLNAVCDVFRYDKSFNILIKVHPRDSNNRIPFRRRYNMPCLEDTIVIEDDCQISKLFVISDHLVTFISSCVVEAVLLNVPFTVIEVPDGAAWPDWDTFKLYRSTPISELKQELVTILNDQCDNMNESDRQAFIERFRYNYDSSASQRIAEATRQILSR